MKGQVVVSSVILVTLSTMELVIFIEEVKILEAKVRIDKAVAKAVAKGDSPEVHSGLVGRVA